MIKNISIVTGVSQPVIWMLLGYQFEAASMVAGLSSCVVVRTWIYLTNTEKSYILPVDVTITALSMLFTAGWVALQRPAPFYALMAGAGFGALGAGIITICLAWIEKITSSTGNDKK